MRINLIVYYRFKDDCATVKLLRKLIQNKREGDGGFIIFRGKTSITLIQYCMAQIKRTRSTELNKNISRAREKSFCQEKSLPRFTRDIKLLMGTNEFARKKSR